MTCVTGWTCSTGLRTSVATGHHVFRTPKPSDETCSDRAASPPRTPDCFVDFLVEHGIPFDIRRMQAGQALPQSIAGHAGYCMLGGPMSANDEVGFPDLRQEKALAQQAMLGANPLYKVVRGVPPKRYSASTFVGFDYHAPSVGQARVAAQHAGAWDRASRWRRRRAARATIAASSRASTACTIWATRSARRRMSSKA